MDRIDELLMDLNGGKPLRDNSVIYQKPEVVEAEKAEISDNEERIECPEKYRKYLLDKDNIMITQEELQALKDNEIDDNTDDEELIKMFNSKVTANFDVTVDDFKDPNDDLPAHFKITERTKFMFDDYLFRIPFSKNLPKKIYDLIFAFEIMRKIIDKPKVQIGIKDYEKILRALAEDLAENVVNGERTIENIKKICIKHHCDKFKEFNFKDLNNPEDFEYDIYPIAEAFNDDEPLPNHVTMDERKEFNALVELVNDYKRDKLAGKISKEGMLRLKDMVEVSEDEDPLEVRNRQWLTEFNIEKWENRCKVIKGELMSLGEYKKLPEYEEERRKELYKPVDFSFKNPLEKTDEEMENLEDQYIDAILTMEETIREARENFKVRKQFFKEAGVKTQAVERALKALKRELKRKPDEKHDEAVVFERICKKSNIISRLNYMCSLAAG